MKIRVSTQLTNKAMRFGLRATNGARLALLAQLEFSKKMEMSARQELQQVRDDSAREQKRGTKVYSRTQSSAHLFK